MKKCSKEDQYFMEVLDEERKYRAHTSGHQAEAPFMTPLLFRILFTLRGIRYTLSLFLGVLLALLIRLLK